jgi:hypothetical protein
MLIDEAKAMLDEFTPRRVALLARKSELWARQSAQVRAWGDTTPALRQELERVVGELHHVEGRISIAMTVLATHEANVRAAEQRRLARAALAEAEEDRG